MTSIEEADSWIGRTAVDSAGEQIGLITKIWVDDASGQPALASVKAGLGGREALVPLAGTTPVGGGRQLTYSKEQIVAAPRPAQGDRLTAGEMERAFAYYGPLDTQADAATSVTGWTDRYEDMAGPPVEGQYASTAAGLQPAPARKQSRLRFGRKSA